MKLFPCIFLLVAMVAMVAWGQGLDFSGHTNLPAGIDMSGTWYPQPGQDVYKRQG